MFVAERIQQKIVPDTETGCWLWTGHVMKSGYGQTWVDGKVVCAHRALYEAMNGPVPPGLWIDHICRVRNCVNPKHLRAVTPRENTLAEGSLAISKHHAEKTHCEYGHELTADNLYIFKGKYRRCRACTLAGQDQRRRERGVPQRPTTHCSRGHEFTPDNTRITHGHWRQCRICEQTARRARDQHAKLNTRNSTSEIGA